MATRLDFVEYTCGQIEGIGAVRHRKMFGEYMVYVNDKPILLICDNTVYVKDLPCIADLCAVLGAHCHATSSRFHTKLDAMMKLRRRSHIIVTTRSEAAIA